MTPKTIEHGSLVRMHFSIYLEDGTVAETSRDDNEPIEFRVGDGTMVQGLELAILGLKPGDKQTLQIGPEVGFGFRDEENIHWMPRSDFAEDMPLEPGVIIGFDTPAGDELPGMVVEVDDEEVKVDFNHPLAGREITFEVEILDVKQLEAANE